MVRNFFAALALCVIVAASPAATRPPGSDDVFIDEETTAETLPAQPVARPPAATKPPPSRPDLYAFEDPALNAVTSPELSRFESEAALKGYIRRVQRITEQRGKLWISSRRNPLTFALLQPGAIPCPPNQVCPESDSLDQVVVSAQSVSAPSITNNQKAGVDEGDIVKQIGPFLLVLQDGRIFSIDTRVGLKLADRANVYRDPESGTWYDEMLVQGDHILVTAYSYDESASEISVFKLDRATGRIIPDGVFLITSDDYYDVDNYATRIVGDRLVIYTPYELEMFDGASDRPVIRRWQTEAERKASLAKGASLLNATDIYRPVMRTSSPVIHTVSVCPLGHRRSGADLACRATAFIGSQQAEMFVSPDDVFLWTSPGYDEVGWTDDCETPRRPARRDVLPAAVFRLPVRGGEPTVLGANGRPFNQFSMDSLGGAFRALVDWSPFRCDRDWEQPVEVAFLDAPLGLFGSHYRPVTSNRLTPAPSPGPGAIENRFADSWLVYGNRSNRYDYAPDKDEPPLSAKVVAVPVSQPGKAQTFALPHNIIRIERVGDDIILNGYRDGSGLDISLLKMGKAPRVTSTAHLARRFESEGRSHAFNSIVERTGEGMIGVPTVKSEDESGRWWWNSEASDVSFLTLGPQGDLAGAGEILNRKQDANPAYECEVSCIDWYGNSRPIFTEGRIFALMGTELVEAQLDGGQIREIRRLDLTTSPGH